MRRLWRRMRVAGIAAGILAVVVLGMLAARNHLAEEPDPRVNLALSGSLLLVLLLFGPLPITSHDTGVRRERSTARLGRLLGTGVWLMQCVLGAYWSNYLAGQLEREFQPVLAGLALLGTGFALVRLWGRQLTGVEIDWSFLRGRAGLRYLANRLVFAAIAGAWLPLAYGAWLAFSYLPAQVYRWLSDVAGTAWLVVPGTVLFCLLLVAVTLAVTAGLQWLAVRLLGTGNPVGAWLDRHALATYRRTRHGTYLKIAGFRYVGNFPPGPSRRQRRQMGRLVRPLPYGTEPEVVKQIERAVVDSATTPDWDTLRLDYRAVTGHAEITLTTTVAGPGGEPAVTRRQLPDFPERDTLWRMREASYVPGYGAWFSWFLEVTRQPPGSGQSGPDGRYRARWQSIRAYDAFAWPVPPLEEMEPAWERPPTRVQYAADLRRFPVVRVFRPTWLRGRLRRRWWGRLRSAG